MKPSTTLTNSPDDGNIIRHDWFLRSNSRRSSEGVSTFSSPHPTGPLDVNRPNYHHYRRQLFPTLPSVYFGKQKKTRSLVNSVAIYHTASLSFSLPITISHLIAQGGGKLSGGLVHDQTTDDTKDLPPKVITAGNVKRQKATHPIDPS